MIPTIRVETVADFGPVRDVNRLAFGREDEANLVDALRRGAHARLSLVAVVDGVVVGHVMFSQLPVETPQGAVAGLSLAPLAVAPSRQNQGIGTALVRRGLQACRDAGYRFVVVLGHPEFYARFGFSAQAAGRLKSPFSGPAFMALGLAPGALDGVEGEVVYPPPFGSF